MNVLPQQQFSLSQKLCVLLKNNLKKSDTSFMAAQLMQKQDFVPSTVPKISPADLSSFKCCEIVLCAKGNSDTSSPQTQLFCSANIFRIAMRAGWLKAFAKPANMISSA